MTMAMIAGHATVDAADRDPYVTAHQDLGRSAGARQPGTWPSPPILWIRSASTSSSAWTPASISMRGGLSPKRRGPRSSSTARHDVRRQRRPTAPRSPRRRSISGKAPGRDLKAGSRGATAGIPRSGPGVSRPVLVKQHCCAPIRTMPAIATGSPAPTNRNDAHNVQLRSPVLVTPNAGWWPCSRSRSSSALPGRVAASRFAIDRHLVGSAKRPAGERCGAPGRDQNAGFRAFGATLRPAGLVVGNLDPLWL